MTESLIAQISGGRRIANDAYFTPLEAIQALIPHIKHWPQPIWEPACGTGNIVKCLNQNGFTVRYSDLHFYGIINFMGVDFLKQEITRGNSIITNPPFNLADKFIQKSFDLGINHVAMLLKSTFWHAKKRSTLFEQHPPSLILALTWWLDFTGAGAPHRDCIWCLWEPNKQPTRYQLLHKPSE